MTKHQAIAPLRVGVPGPAAPHIYFVAPEKLISGNPRQTLWLEFESPDGQFSTGLWASEPGEWRVNYTEQEYMRILEGKNFLTDAAGNSHEFGPGDEFVVPVGFQGIWQVVVATRKCFVTLEASAKPPASDASVA
jgi:uncharacterized protein